MKLNSHYTGIAFVTIRNLETHISQDGVKRICALFHNKTEIVAKQRASGSKVESSTAQRSSQSV